MCLQSDVMTNSHLQVLDYVQVGIGKTAINLATMLSGAVSAALIVSWYMEELESDAQTCWCVREVW